MKAPGKFYWGTRIFFGLSQIVALVMCLLAVVKDNIPIGLYGALGCVVFTLIMFFGAKKS
jgi:hypothetical protein